MPLSPRPDPKNIMVVFLAVAIFFQVLVSVWLALGISRQMRLRTRGIVGLSIAFTLGSLAMGAVVFLGTCAITIGTEIFH